MSNQLMDLSHRSASPAALVQRRSASVPSQVPQAAGAPQAKTIQLQMQRMADRYSQHKYGWAMGLTSGPSPVQRVLQVSGKHRLPANEVELINDINANNVTVSPGQTFHTAQDVQQVGISKKWTVTYNANVLDWMGRNFEGDMSYVIHAHYDVTDTLIQMHVKDSHGGQVLFYINGPAAQTQITAI